MRCFKGGLPGGFDIHQLPMLYTGALGFDVTYSLALSFLAFLISGLIGSFNYYKVGNLDVKMSAKLGLGSLIGAIGGVFLQGLIEKSTAKTILYLVVLFSGTSILIRIIKEYHKTKASKQNPAESTDSISGSTISANGLKLFVAVFSICIAIYMLL